MAGPVSPRRTRTPAELAARNREYALAVARARAALERDAPLEALEALRSLEGPPRRLGPIPATRKPRDPAGPYVDERARYTADQLGMRWMLTPAGRRARNGQELPDGEGGP
jgi:hypothetical protein